jgi:DinB family protein
VTAESKVPAKLAELLEYMDSTRAALVACALNMNPSFARIRPRDEVWSAADNLAHLVLVEEFVVDLMAKSIAKAREEGIGADASDESFMRSLDRWRVPEPLMKVIAPARITPDNSKSVEDSLQALDRSRARLRSILTENTDVDLSAIKRTHPLLRDLDMYQWALFVAQHEDRHRKQMERALAETTERAAECAPIV